MLLTALARLLEGYGLEASQIGRLEVGTETLIDKSKSVKTTLLAHLFGSGHADVEGVTSTNACYGGTAAFLNCVNWMQSEAWDGRYAVSVASDVAAYSSRFHFLTSAVAAARSTAAPRRCSSASSSAATERTISDEEAFAAVEEGDEATVAKVKAWLEAGGDAPSFRLLEEE